MTRRPDHTRVATPSEQVRLEDLRIQFERGGERLTALDRVNLSVAAGEFLAVVGPSGCGKSTLLNALAGLLIPTAGRILVDGKLVTGINRQIGYVTQNDHLLPWRNLRSNVELPLELRGYGPSERRQLAEEFIGLVGLSGFETHYPYELSGGMRQRANIIRALVYDPPLVVMDEPFGSLDAFTREDMQKLVLQLWERKHRTIIFITHDLSEAIVLADRVAVVSRRPGTVKAVVDIDIPRPRDAYNLRTTETFQRHYTMLWNLLASEVRTA